MQLAVNPETLGPSVVVLGMFDGVHLGHQALLKAGRKLADEAGVPLCVCTFEPHPLEVLAPDRAPKRLTLPEERARVMADCGVDVLCIHDFTMERAGQPPLDFLEDIQAVYQPKAVVCGFNFSFGSRGAGSPEMLVDYGAQHGFAVQVIPPVTMDGETVSSTRIRKALAAGNMQTVAALLGENYQLSGEVVQEENGLCVQVSAQKALPCDGVYVGKANGCEVAVCIHGDTVEIQPIHEMRNITVELISKKRI